LIGYDIIFGYPKGEIAKMIQLDFFQEYNETEILRQEVKQLKESQDKVRKKLFAEHGKLAKMYLEMYQEFEDWKAIVAKGYCKL
jgi:hypothetical protein